MAVLTDTLQKSLDAQRDEVLEQFSLDQKESALSRLLTEVTSNNGKLRSELADDLGKVMKEFSLDNEDGALSRLGARVENTQTLLEDELSLDAEGSALQRLSSLLEKAASAVETSLTLDDDASPLARLKREILGVLSQQRESALQFQTEVRSTLEVFKPGWQARVLGTDLQQLWLDHLLVLSMIQHPSKRWSGGRFVLVYPSENPSFRAAAARYRELLRDASTFDDRTLEDMVRLLPNEFAIRDRYL